MLATLILLGLLALAAMPFFEGEDTDSGDAQASAQGTAPVPVEGGGILEALGEPGIESVEFDGDFHQIDPTPGTSMFNDFEPDHDLVLVDLSSVEGPIYFDQASDETGSVVSFSTAANATTTLAFPELGSLPGGDIILRLEQTEEGSFLELSLDDAVQMAQVLPKISDESEPVAIGPNDPDSPDEPGPEDDGGPVLDPLDPDLPDQEHLLDPVTEVIQPTPPGAIPLGEEADQTLTGILADSGVGEAGMQSALLQAEASSVVETTLGAGDDVTQLADDGVAGTGAGQIATAEGTPVITSDAPIEVLDAGAGNDLVQTGDEAAFAYGGQGDDTLVAGEGAAALLGGDGDDQLIANETGAFLHGGADDDLLVGGAGDDTLEGGEHEALGVGDDTIGGGSGNDVIRGGYGADSLFGGTGDDVIDHLGRNEESAVAEHHEFGWHLDNAADSLSGGEGDDTLIFDRADTASGGAGADQFWLYFDGADSGAVPEITDFEIGEDFLRVQLNPQIGENGEPDVEIRASDDGDDGLVFVNGDHIVTLLGAPEATLSDIYVEVAPDVFPAGPVG